MELDATKTVRDLATEIPGAARIFEKFGIDYCCEGSKPLHEACREADIPVHAVLRSLEDQTAFARQVVSAGRDFKKVRLAELISHIRATHHEFLLQEIPRLKKLLFKVVAVHCRSHPELAAVQRTFNRLADELLARVSREETELFPYIEELEQAASDGRSARQASFGSIGHRVRMMELEHEAAGISWQKIHGLTAAYAPPEYTDFTYQILYAGLREFEDDLREHERLESKILFPRAIALEKLPAASARTLASAGPAA